MDLEGIRDARPAGLGAFEAWDPLTGAPKGHAVSKAFVSITASGSLGFNAASREMLGNPRNVELLFDPKGRRIAIRAAGESEAAREPRGSSRIHRGSSYSFDPYGSGHVSVPAKTFLDHYGVPYGPRSVRYTPYLVDGALVINL